MPIRWKVVRQDRTSCVITQESKHSVHYPLGATVKERKEAGIFQEKRK